VICFSTWIFIQFDLEHKAHRLTRNRKPPDTSQTFG
jgi:hypothetical protein